MKSGESDGLQENNMPLAAVRSLSTVLVITSTVMLLLLLLMIELQYFPQVQYMSGAYSISPLYLSSRLVFIVATFEL